MRFLLLAIVLTGCWPDQDNVLFDEPFQPGWEARWTGDTWQVGTTETVFAGEQGAYFAGPATISVPVAVSIYDGYSDGLWVEYSSTCGGAPLLTLSGSTLWLDLPVATYDLDPDGAWNRVHLNVPASYPSLTITQLSVATAGTPTQACVVDNLRIVEPAVDYAF